MKTKFNIGDRVQGGKPGTEDFDTGRIRHSSEKAPAKNMVWVSWESGVSTWAPKSTLKPAVRS